MEGKFEKKSKKISFDSLLSDEKMLYYKQAEYLHDKGYCLDRNVFNLAEELYNAKWRKS